MDWFSFFAGAIAILVIEGLIIAAGLWIANDSDGWY